MDDETLSLLAGIGVGAALGISAMYILDPDMGNRRRALVRDKLEEAQAKTRRASGATARDLWNRTAGTLAEVGSRFSRREVTDEALEGRVRSKLGFLVRHPSAITTRVLNGRVFLSGRVLPDELKQLLKGVRAVRGVQGLEDQLTVRDDAQQDDKLKPGGEVWDIMQRRWSPSTRFLVSAAGAISLVLMAYSRADGSRYSSSRAREERRKRFAMEPEETRGGWTA
jgi:hypothetical protein